MKKKTPQKGSTSGTKKKPLTTKKQTTRRTKKVVEEKPTPKKANPMLNGIKTLFSLSQFTNFTSKYYCPKNMKSIGLEVLKVKLRGQQSEGAQVMNDTLNVPPLSQELLNCLCGTRTKLTVKTLPGTFSDEHTWRFNNGDSADLLHYLERAEVVKNHKWIISEISLRNIKTDVVSVWKRTEVRNELGKIRLCMSRVAGKCISKSNKVEMMSAAVLFYEDGCTIKKKVPSPSYSHPICDHDGWQNS